MKMKELREAIEKRRDKFMDFSMSDMFTIDERIYLREKANDLDLILMAIDRNDTNIITKVFH